MSKKSNLLSRMSLILTIIMLCTMIAFADTGTSVSQTSDWISNGWSLLYGGQPFQADKNLTRGEMLALINSLFNLKEQKEITFTDVPKDSIYYNEVSKAFAAGYIKGKGNDIFDPNGEIIRIEAYIMIGRVLKLNMNQPANAMLSFKDASEVPEWAVGAVEALAQKGWINGQSKVKPFDKFLGSEAVALLEKASVQTEVKGNGNAALNLLGTYFAAIQDNKSIELGKIEDGNSSKDFVIKLVFDRGIVRDYWENNQKQITLKDNKGSTIESEVFRIEGSDAEKSNIFIRPLVELKAGKTVNIVIGKDLKANNGNTLGQDITVTFTVK